jgi:hypothetical protein
MAKRNRVEEEGVHCHPKKIKINKKGENRFIGLSFR